VNIAPTSRKAIVFLVTILTQSLALLLLLSVWKAHKIYAEMKHTFIQIKFWVSGIVSNRKKLYFSHFFIFQSKILFKKRENRVKMSQQKSWSNTGSKVKSEYTFYEFWWDFKPSLDCSELFIFWQYFTREEWYDEFVLLAWFFCLCLDFRLITIFIVFLIYII
jgi:hypothetical protein